MLTVTGSLWTPRQLRFCLMAAVFELNRPLPSWTWKMEMKLMPCSTKQGAHPPELLYIKRPPAFSGTRWCYAHNSTSAFRTCLSYSYLFSQFKLFARKIGDA